MRFEWLLPQRREQISSPPPPICALNCDVSIFEIGGMSAGKREGWRQATTIIIIINCRALTTSLTIATKAQQSMRRRPAPLPPSASTAANTLNLNHEPQRPQCIASRLKWSGSEKDAVDEAEGSGQPTRWLSRATARAWAAQTEGRRGMAEGSRESGSATQAETESLIKRKYFAFGCRVNSARNASHNLCQIFLQILSIPFPPPLPPSLLHPPLLASTA